MFYGINLFFVGYSLFIYALFRGGIYDYLRVSGRSKTYIHKNRKGMKNYWLYARIHQQHPIGGLYHLNWLYLFTWLAYAAVTILLGYLSFFRIPIQVLAVLLGILQLPCVIVFTKYDALALYGKPFILCKLTTEGRRIYSSLLNWASWLVSAFFVFAICTRL